MLDDTKSRELDPVKHHPLLHEMIRSFIGLAKCLNLSRTVQELGSTRQTVRRHIETLELCMGEKLFEVVDRRYVLTQAGHRALPMAEMLLAQGQFWLSGQLRDIDGMRVLSHTSPNGACYFQQQQPLDTIWTGQSELLKAALEAWAAGNGQLEHDAMKPVRPYILVYRETPVGWMCVEIGESSFYSKWWGWANARSSVGRVLEQFQGGSELAALMQVPFTEIQSSHGVRLDQLVTHIPRTAGGPIEIAVVHRLLLGSYFADGSFALTVVVDRSKEVMIDGLDSSVLSDMPVDAEVNFGM